MSSVSDAWIWEIMLCDTQLEGLVGTAVRRGLLILGEVAQSCPTLCNPMDCSLPGSSVSGIPQARILECVAISFSFNVVAPYLRYVFSPSFCNLHWFCNAQAKSPFYWKMNIKTPLIHFHLSSWIPTGLQWLTGITEGKFLLTQINWQLLLSP